MRLFPGRSFFWGTVITTAAASRNHAELEGKGRKGEDRDSWIGQWIPVRVDDEVFAGEDGFYER